MPANGHALLSASASSRWLNCTPSARLCEAFEDEESEFALEGTDAHALCEHRLRKSLGEEVGEEPKLERYSNEMSDCANAYVEYISEKVSELKKIGEPIVLVEQHLDFSKYVPDGFGTGDCVIVSDKKLEIIDFKYGKGVEVSAEKNTQMLLYSLGAIETFGFLYEIEMVEMTIFQPRLGNVSSYEISVKDLIKWAEEVLVPKAKLAYEGKGEFVCGDHCRFCKAKKICKKRAQTHLNLLKFDFKEPPLLTDEEVEDILDKVETLVSWAEDVKGYALEEALKGKRWERYKLVEGRSNRKITDEQAVVEAVTKEGFDPYEKKLLSITELQKRIGKVRFKELVEPYVIKPQGKPTLVARDDRRDELSIAASDFADLGEYDN